jgi:tRNA threonylcarbamoyladenosine biosynthesis protein TsaB
LRTLGIETSSVRGSVALIEADLTLAVASHERENAHESAIQALIERALSEAGWNPRQLDRVAVGTGPGSFTGLRVGIALAQGIAEGLEIPLVGVGSLRALAGAAPRGDERARVPVIDARRGELFLAAYSAAGLELLAPQVAANADVAEQLIRSLPGGVLLLGRASAPLWASFEHDTSPDAELPHARWTAFIGATLPADASANALYLRPAVAAAAQLRQNPLSVEAAPAGGLPLPGVSESAAARSDCVDRHR